MFKPSRTSRLLRTVILVPVLLTVAFAAYAEDQVSRREAYYQNLKIIGEVYERILENYVDEEDPQAIMEAAIQGMLKELDEHSNYLPPVTYEDLVMSTEGEFGGLGIT